MNRHSFIFAATPWNTNRLGGRKSEFSRNIFGGTFGGPLLRNKVFFFADYQGGRDNTPPTDAFTTVVPDEWRRGDLSDLLARNLVIRDPLTGLPFPNNSWGWSRPSKVPSSLALAAAGGLPLAALDGLKQLPRRRQSSWSDSSLAGSGGSLRYDWRWSMQSGST